MVKIYRDYPKWPSTLPLLPYLLIYEFGVASLHVVRIRLLDAVESGGLHRVATFLELVSKGASFDGTIEQENWLLSSLMMKVPATIFNRNERLKSMLLRPQIRFVGNART